jgi:hypothetical protein
MAELSTSHPGIVRALWAEPRRPKEWEEVGMLCRHHLVTFTDGKAVVGDYRLLLDNELGLRVVKDGDDTGEDE